MPETPDLPVTIRRLDATSAEALAPQLRALLQDAVASGASLGFWRPLDDARAADYWRGVIDAVTVGDRWLLAAMRDGAVVGSVQMEPSRKQNAPHRAEVQKLMAHRTARRRGVGRALMLAAERLAADAGRTLLVLDTNTDSDAVHFYRALGYIEAGSIPHYSLEPDASGRATTIFYKLLAAEA